MPSVVLRSTNNVSPQTQNGSIEVDRCAKQYGISLGGLAAIRQSNPVPARQSVALDVTAYDADIVQFEIVDSQGRTVATLADVAVEAGTQAITIDAVELASGAYVARCSGRSGRIATARVLVVR